MSIYSMLVISARRTEEVRLNKVHTVFSSRHECREVRSLRLVQFERWEGLQIADEEEDPVSNLERELHRLSGTYFFQLIS